MTQQSDLTKHFEKILGRALDLGGSGEVVLRERVASYTKDDGSTTSRDIGTTGNSTKACGAANLLDVGGTARTGQDGTTEFMLSEFFCHFSGRNSLSFEFPANFVATPRSQSPVFLTALASPTSDRRDVGVRVATWAPNGSPAPNTSFDWRCRVPYETVIVID